MISNNFTDFELEKINETSMKHTFTIEKDGLEKPIDPLLLFTEITNFLRDQLTLSKLHISTYQISWRQWLQYLGANHMTLISRHAMDSYLKHKYGTIAHSKLKKVARSKYIAMESLLEYIASGVILPHLPKPKVLSFNNGIGISMLEYLSYRKSVDAIGEKRLKACKKGLYRFYDYCSKNNVKSCNQVENVTIQNHIIEYEGSTFSLLDDISILKGFFLYANQRGYCQSTFENVLHGGKRKYTVRKPAVYTSVELIKLLDSIDRSTDSGCRNYAVIILIITTGLRAKDVAQLSFDNIDFKKMRVTLIQSKNNKSITKILFPEVKNAIENYSSQVRKYSSNRQVFLSLRPPRTQLTASSVSGLVSTAFKDSGVDTGIRSFGSHSLRHSYAARLMESDASMFEISQALGHSILQVTKDYLRIDSNALAGYCRQVPPLVSVLVNNLYRDEEISKK